MPDISGYTGLVDANTFTLSHAHFIIRQLLDALVAAGVSVFSPSRIEGDAVLFFAGAADVAARPKAFSGVVRELFAAFEERRQELLRRNACPCSACEKLQDLDLKMVAHRGEAIQFSIGALQDFTGEALVVVHRLLKNDLDRRRYLLVSQAAAEIWPAPLPGDAVSHRLRYPDVGEIECWVFDVPPIKASSREDGKPSAVSRLRDLGAKGRESLRAALKSGDRG